MPMLNFQYQSAEIGLKPFDASDLTHSNYVKWFLDIGVTMYTSHNKFPKTEEDFRQYMKSLSDKDKIVWSIFYLIDKESKSCIHVGNVSLQEIDFMNSSAEVAIIIGESDFWSKGIATRALKFVIRHAFDMLGLNRIWAGVIQDNAGMNKVFDKLKFTKEGFERKSLYCAGEFRNVNKWSLLKFD